MSWPMVKLGTVADINPSGPRSGEIADDVALDFVPMASVSERGCMTVEEQRSYSEVKKGFTAFRDDDVLLAKITPCFENNKITRATVSTAYAFGSTEFHVLRTKRDLLDPNYLTYYLRQDHIRLAGERRMTGSGGQRRVPKAFLEELPIPLPPLEEQKRIAGILDQADALRRLRARALEKLNTLGQAVFQEMFGDPSSVRRASLGEIIEVRSSLDDPKKDENKSLPHVGPEHIAAHSGMIDWSNVRTCEEDGVVSGKYRFLPEDILFSKIRPYLNKVAISNRFGMCSADMYAIVTKDKVATQQYIKFVLSSGKFLEYASTVSNRANIPKINREQLLNYNCPLPDIRDQEAFHSRVTQIEAEAVNLQCSLAKANDLFASLQSAAFQGRL